MRLFVSNINYEAREDELEALFKEAGFQPKSVKLCSDRTTGAPRGFAFVDFWESEDAENARRSLDGWTFMGRRINVQQAREQPVEEGDRRGDGRASRRFRHAGRG